MLRVTIAPWIRSRRSIQVGNLDADVGPSCLPGGSDPRRIHRPPLGCHLSTTEAGIVIARKAASLDSACELPQLLDRILKRGLLETRGQGKLEDSKESGQREWKEEGLEVAPDPRGDAWMDTNDELYCIPN